MARADAATEESDSRAVKTGCVVKPFLTSGQNGPWVVKNGSRSGAVKSGRGVDPVLTSDTVTGQLTGKNLVKLAKSLTGQTLDWSNLVKPFTGQTLHWSNPSLVKPVVIGVDQQHLHLRLRLRPWMTRSQMDG
jgi:hypothetical protein